MKAFILLFLSVLFSGCGGPSFYSHHTCVITAQTIQDNAPASGYPFRVLYPYDHYGVLYVWNPPMPVEGTLDQQGKAVINIATFAEPHMVIGSNIFKLRKEIITQGGNPTSFPYRSSDDDYRKYRERHPIYGLPPARLPEVKVIIRREAEDAMPR